MLNSLRSFGEETLVYGAQDIYVLLVSYGNYSDVVSYTYFTKDIGIYFGDDLIGVSVSGLKSIGWDYRKDYPEIGPRRIGLDVFSGQGTKLRVKT